jgi:hypothetical protein
VRKLILIAIVVCCPILGHAQFTYPATSTQNIFTNTNQFTIGIESGPMVFSQLLQLNPMTTNMIYVSDATFGSNPCSGFGTGAFAFYINGAWDCSFGGGGGGGGGTTYTGISPIVVNNISNQISAPTVIQGAPTLTQNIFQPVATSLNTNVLNNVRWVPSASTPVTTGSANWQQTIATALTGGSLSTVTLVPCPVGIFGSDATSFVYISSAPTETVQLAGGGSCTPGATSGTIVFTPVNNHSGGYTIGSASAGIQETITDAAANGSNAPGLLYHVIFPPSNPASSTPYVVRARVNLWAGYADIDFSGVMIDCEALYDTCFYAGSSAGNIVLHGARVFTKTTVPGAPITQTSCSSNVSTITSTLNPPVGGWVDIQWTDNPHYWGIYQVVSTSVSSWTFTDNNCGHAGSPGAGTIATATTPGGNAAEHAFLEDNGFSIALRDIYYDFSTFAGHNMLNSFVVVDGDQYFLWDHGVMSGGTYCGPDYCGQAVYAPAASAGTPIGVLSHVNMTLNCGGNGVKWLGGQGLVMTNESVIQGFAQYGIASGALRGSSGPTMLDGSYEEVGACYNPFMIAAGFPTATLSAVSAAGVEQFNSPLYITKTAAAHSPSLQGFEPDFSNAGGGTTLYEYWLVINDGANSSVPLRFGHAAPASSASYLIGWPRYASQTGSTVTYTVLRTSSPTTVQPTAPFGTAVNSLTSTPIAQCSGSEIYYCTMSDSTATALQSYTVATTAGLIPDLFNWPGTAVLGGGALFYSDSGLPLGASAAYVTTLAGQPEVFSLNQDQVTPGVFNISSAISVGAGGSTTGTSWGGQMMPNGQVTSQPMGDQRKGRLNFLGFQQSLSPSHIITLNDSNPFKTIADAAHRPQWDANDCYIGFDVPSTGATSANAQLSIGCAKSVSQYVGNVGDGVAWGERLTATQKTFQVPIIGLSSLTVTGSANGLAFPFSLSGAQVSNVLGSATGWTTNGGSGASCNISGGIAVLGVGSDSKVFCSYTNSVLSNAQYVLAQLTALGSLQGGVGVRMSNSAETGYFFLCIAGSSSVIYRYNAGTPIAITSGGPPCVVGDYLLLEIVGSSLSAFDLTQGFTLTGTDSNIASGYPGLFGTPFNGITFTNFRAGNWTYGTGSPISAPTATGVYEAGVLNANELIYTNKQSLTSGTATHTFAGSFTYTSSSTFGCTCTDQTAANACSAAPASANTVALLGTGGDVLWLSCSGH